MRLCDVCVCTCVACPDITHSFPCVSISSTAKKLTLSSYVAFSKGQSTKEIKNEVATGLKKNIFMMIKVYTYMLQYMNDFVIQGPAK